MAAERLHPDDVPPPGSPHRLRRAPAKGAYDRTTIDAILDATPFCHLGYVHEDRPVVIPTLQARRGDHVLVHASSGSRLGLATAAAPWPVCLTVSIVDELVLARSGFHHSINHRSVIVHGDAELIVEPDEILAALRTITDAVAPGRWAELRPPTSRELEATAVVRLPLDQASAKVRTGPPLDEPTDYVRSTVWAGTVPLRTSYGTPIPDPALPDGTPLSRSVQRLLDDDGPAPLGG